jgi:Rod binding domain-containing protein
MAQKFSNLRAQMTPEAQYRAAARAEAILLEMRLQELRKTNHATSIEALPVQSNRHDDMYVSTLREYVKALGGELKLVASFPDAEIPVHPFEFAH